MVTYYHASPPWNAEAIEREGLVPQGGDPVHLTIDRVYASAAWLHGCEEEELAVWEVDVKGLGVSPGWDGDYDEDGTKEFAAVYGRIPPDRLRRLPLEVWQEVGLGKWG